MSAATADPAAGWRRPPPSGASLFSRSSKAVRCVSQAPGCTRRAFPASASRQASRVGRGDGIFLPVASPLAGVCGTRVRSPRRQRPPHPPVTAPSLCLEATGCSSVSGEGRCGGLREQLSEVTWEAPNVVCRISLCSKVRRASPFQPVSREKSPPRRLASQGGWSEAEKTAPSSSTRGFQLSPVCAAFQPGGREGRGMERACVQAWRRRFCPRLTATVGRRRRTPRVD